MGFLKTNTTREENIEETAAHFDVPPHEWGYTAGTTRVREWAEANGIVLSTIGEIGDNLKMLWLESGTLPLIHR